MSTNLLGIKRSKKAPKSDTKNPNPKGKGTAKGSAKNTRSAKVSKRDEKTLQNKSDEFNERYKKKLGYGVTVGMLKTVFQRGLGAFNVSHSPRVRSASQWAQARVNAFLYLVKNGRPQNKKYTGDFDLLPGKHPKKPAICYHRDVGGVSLAALRETGLVAGNPASAASVSQSHP